MRALEDFEQRPFECFHGPGASAERYPGALCRAAEIDGSLIVRRTAKEDAKVRCVALA